MIKVRLKPKQGINVNTKTTYIYDNSLIEDEVALAKDWAIKTDGKVIEDGEEVDYSSKYYAGLSESSATEAKTSETNAKTSETNASTSATNASASEGVAIAKAKEASVSASVSATSASNASTYASNAQDSASAASSSATAAKTSETNAKTSETNAKESETNALQSATSASASETRADASATSAANSESVAISKANTATEQAGIATTKAGEASTSATTATEQAGIATTKAGEASASATTASEQAGIATTKAGEASASATTATTQAGIATDKAEDAAESEQHCVDIEKRIGTVFNIKGRVDTVNDLPTTGNKAGDLYFVGLATDTSFAEYVWVTATGTDHWEMLGTAAASISFSAITGSYSDNTSLKNAIDSKQDAGNYMTTDTEQTIDASAVKTFNGRVNFIGSGDSNAVYISTNTRFDVYGGTATVLGFSSGTFLINHSSYALNLRGSGTRPTYNGGTNYLALYSDTTNKVVANTAITASTTKKLVTYDTKGLVTGGSALASSDVTGALGFTPISGIDYNMVTTALGYTPYDATNPDGYITSDYHDSTKQDTLPSGTTGYYLQKTASGVQWAEVKSAPDTDGKSITTNSSSQLQTVGVINSRDSSTAIKTWTGTKAQYDAITTKDTNTLYNITDDSDTSLTILQTIYPVGSIYITTNAICPLAALFGTWETVGTKILTDNPSDVPVKGNGMTIGITDGSVNAGISSNTSALAFMGVNQYGKSIGTAQDSGTYMTTSKVVGLTTDSSKSGIVADLSSVSTLTVNIFRRTA